MGWRSPWEGAFLVVDGPLKSIGVSAAKGIILLSIMACKKWIV